MASKKLRQSALKLKYMVSYDYSLALTITGSVKYTYLYIILSALDAALPGFTGNSTISPPVSASDADFVIAFYSDAGYFGAKHKIGHVNVLVNGGTRHQPGCNIAKALRRGHGNPTRVMEGMFRTFRTTGLER